jgi:diacylglycerol kinase family enzyme
MVVNPAATTTSPRMRDVLVSALRGGTNVELDVVTTVARGQGRDIGAEARAKRYDLVVTFGGDGTVHEVVNGLLADGPGPDVPALAPLPGGSANVLARSLGLLNDPIEATGQVLEAIAVGRRRTINVGRADGQWFTVNAGFGLDAEIIHTMETMRGAGRAATPLRYFTTSTSQFFRSDRKHPRLTVEPDGASPIENVFLVIVQNTSPWTYLGPLAVSPSPLASFDAGLDAWCVQSMALPRAVALVTRMLRQARPKPSEGRIALVHDSSGFTVQAATPIPWQVDGEARPAASQVRFESVPRALTVVV